MSLIDDAFARLPATYRGTPEQPTTTELALRAVLTPLVPLRQAVDDLITQTSIDNATGVWLDEIGVIVGRPRAGVNDDTYRRYLRAQIATNKSSGTIPEILRIARLIVGDGPTLKLRNTGACAYVLEVDAVDISPETSTVLLTMLRKATAGANRVITVRIPNVALQVGRWGHTSFRSSYLANREEPPK